MSVQEKQSKWSPFIWVLCWGRQLIFMVWDNQFDFNLRIDMNCLKMLSKEHIFKVSNGTRSSFSWRTLEKWEERREERPWTGRRKSAVCWSSYSLELVNRLSCRQLQNKGRDITLMAVEGGACYICCDVLINDPYERTRSAERCAQLKERLARQQSAFPPRPLDTLEMSPGIRRS